MTPTPCMLEDPVTVPQAQSEASQRLATHSEMIVLVEQRPRNHQIWLSILPGSKENWKSGFPTHSNCMGGPAYRKHSIDWGMDSASMSARSSVFELVT